MFSRSLSFRSLLLPLLSLAAFAPSFASAQQIAAWGSNDFGQSTVPSGMGVVTTMAAGTQHGLALKANGTVRAWGRNSEGQCDVPAGLIEVVRIAAGGYFSFALKSNNTAVGWGDNTYGQLDVPTGIGSISRIGAGFYHTVALKSDGSVAAWGRNTEGQCNVPAGLTNVTGVSGGGLYSLALKANGTVVAWGDNTYGQTSVPAGLNGVVQISAGTFHASALKSDGTVVVWGNNEDGQGNVPAGLNNVFTLGAGGAHMLALQLGNAVVAWGNNDMGQGTVPTGLPPTVDISAGDQFNLALLPGGVELDRKLVNSGDIVTGTVILADAPGAGGATFTLAAEDPSIHVPATVFVPAGANTATFPVTTDLSFHGIGTTHIYASQGGITYSTEFKMIDETASLAISQSSFVGGSTSKPALTLSLGYVPASDLKLKLESDNAAVTLPATITVPAGQSSVRFFPAHAIVPTTLAVQVTVRDMGGFSVASNTLNLRPLTATLTFVPTEVIGGMPSRGFVQLNAAVSGPLTIPLTNGDATKLGIPASFQIGKGDRAGYFPVSTALITCRWRRP
ncbi:hypothetical protein EON81_22655 [bacterium]|nr:MAG: hypothetical protein EON81_22655 [bacterium]